MAQLDLFGSAPRVLAEDEGGGIVYHPQVMQAKQAAALFTRLLSTIEWKSERRMMYDREVDVPRLGSSVRAPDAASFGLDEALGIAQDVTGASFTGIGLNYYRDGHDSVAPHNDTLRELLPGAPIALLSLGATRRMTIRSKSMPRHILDLDLDAGSLLVMSHASQFTYDHGIPKTASKVGPRISLAFRARAAVAEAAKEAS